MKRYLLLMPVILATTAAIADTAAIRAFKSSGCTCAGGGVAQRPIRHGESKAEERSLAIEHPLSSARRTHRRRRRRCSAAFVMEVK